MNIILNDILSDNQQTIPEELLSNPLTETYTDLGGGFLVTSAVPLTHLSLAAHDILSVNIVEDSGGGAVHSIDITSTRHAFETFSEIPPDTYRIYFIGGQQKTGRLMLGTGEPFNMQMEVSRTQTYDHTFTSNMTASGQEIEGLGGVSLLNLSLGLPYTIDESKYNIVKDRINDINRGRCYLFDFTTENVCGGGLPPYFYAKFKSIGNMTSELQKFLYSGRWELEERK